MGVIRVLALIGKVKSPSKSVIYKIANLDNGDINELSTLEVKSLLNSGIKIGGLELNKGHIRKAENSLVISFMARRITEGGI